MRRTETYMSWHSIFDGFQDFNIVTGRGPLRGAFFRSGAFFPGSRAPGGNTARHGPLHLRGAFFRRGAFRGDGALFRGDDAFDDGIRISIRMLCFSRRRFRLFGEFVLFFLPFLITFQGMKKASAISD